MLINTMMKRMVLAALLCAGMSTYYITNMQAATSDSTSRTNSSAAQSATVNADGTVSDDGTGDNERHITYECDRACGDTLVTFWENGHAVGNHWMTGVCFNGTMQLD